MSNVRAAYADAKIYFMTLESNSDVCSEIKDIDEILTIDISNPVSFILDFFKCVSRLGKIKFDRVYDFEFYTYFSAVIVSFLKVSKSIGFDNFKNNRKLLFTDVIPFENKIHTKANFLNLVRADNLFKEKIYSNGYFPEIKSEVSNKTDDFIITVNPNASGLAYERRLPGENFIEIIDHLTGKFKCKVLLTGLKEESKYVKSIYASVKNKSLVENVCGKTSVRELFKIIKSSVCLITNDSGPLHIASALNVPVIAFFGPESPQRYGPLSDRNLVFYNGLGCSPCMSISNSKTVNCKYDSPICIEQFNMKDVISRIDQFVKVGMDSGFKMDFQNGEDEKKFLSSGVTSVSG